MRGCVPSILDMKQRTKDNLIYLVVALAIAGAFTGYMFYSERATGKIQEISRPILWVIFSTPGIVALVLERFWEYRRSRSLWVILMAAASINVVAVWVAHYYRWDPPLIVWSAMTGAWIVAVFIVAQKFVARDRSRE